MTLPRQKDIEIPLLEEMAKAGGAAEPKQLYPLIKKHFPKISAKDMTARIACGHLAWHNRI